MKRIVVLAALLALGAPDLSPSRAFALIFQNYPTDVAREARFVLDSIPARDWRLDYTLDLANRILPRVRLVDLEKLATAGDARAQTILGFAEYHNSRNDEVERAEGRRWLEKAADHGDPRAQGVLANIFENGRGVPTNLKEAARLYLTSAKGGYAIAQYSLGWMYNDGRGVAQDYGQALTWFHRAADQGFVDAEASIGVEYARGQLRYGDPPRARTPS